MDKDIRFAIPATSTRNINSEWQYQSSNILSDTRTENEITATWHSEQTRITASNVMAM